MQDDEKINDDDEVSGSGLVHLEYGSGDMLMKENQDGETVTDISESGDDEREKQVKAVATLVKSNTTKSNSTGEKARVQVSSF